MDSSQAILLIFVFAAGIAVGVVVALAASGRSERRRKGEVEALLNEVKANFGSLSLQALSQATEQLAAQAGQRLVSERSLHVQELDGKKRLIDEQLANMAGALKDVSRLMGELERNSSQRSGELAGKLNEMSQQTSALAGTTAALRQALADSRARGQWGERMAEDVLRVAGFLENVNYRKQQVIEGAGSRPDFTFFLPRDLVLNMDVKFPLDNYLLFLGAEAEGERSRLRGQFLKDVRNRVREITTRDYINPESKTVDCVLLFIPNEQIYAFIHEQDSALLDDALRNKVVLCSPITLFAILAVIRQAVDSFVLAQTSNEILTLLGAFRKQWDRFVERMDVLGRRIQETQKEYDAIVTTRRQQLEKPLNRIERVRQEHGLEPAEDVELLPAGGPLPALPAGAEDENGG